MNFYDISLPYFSMTTNFIEVLVKDSDAPHGCRQLSVNQMDLHRLPNSKEIFVHDDDNHLRVVIPWATVPRKIQRIFEKTSEESLRCQLSRHHCESPEFSLQPS